MPDVPVVYVRRKAILTALACAALPSLSAAQDAETTILDEIQVTAKRDGTSSEATGSYAPATSETALKLDLSYRETPQSVSVITRQQMDDFGQVDINDVLAGTTGVTVESVEADRTYYTSRGFDINNFQYDGVGLPAVYDNIQGSLDTAFYDRVEVLRGANGLMSGTGNPSATVNFIRKRPTAATQASVAVTGGSFNNRRVVGDLSGAVVNSGKVRGRVVAGYQNRDSYLDRYSNEKQMFYGVLEADVTDTTLLTLGHSVQTSNTDRPLWGALPLFYSDGSPTDYDRSTSTSADWAYWDNTQNNSFVELKQQLDGGWQIKATVTRLENDSDSELFYQYGSPDPDTGEGLRAYPSQYDLTTTQLLGDVSASGPFDLAGRVHELVVGATWSRSDTVDESRYGQGIGDPLPPLEEWTGDYPRPSFDNGVAGSDWTDRQISGYTAVRWTLADQLTAITGLRMTWLDSKGDSYGATKATSYDAVKTPYVGLIYDLTDNASVYTSYTAIFKPQAEVDMNGNRLDPVDGTNLELGLKNEYMAGRVKSTVALFHTEQNNLAEAAGTIAGTADTYYRGVDGVTSRGVELELAGDVTESIQLFAGYTYIDVVDADGHATKPYIPHQIAQLRGTWAVPHISGLELGSQVRWQSAISQNQGTVSGGANDGQRIVTRQPGYAVLDLMASYDFSRHWNATLNVNNVTNEKYIESLKKFGTSAQGYYGAPANANLTVSWTY